MLFVKPDLLLWLPMIGNHLLFFSGFTLRKGLHNVEWAYLRYSLWLTGHSLGGAVAQAVGYCLNTLHPISVRRVVTFGAPCIGGTLKWAAPAKLSGYRVDRWVNAGDPVPRDYHQLDYIIQVDPRTHRLVLWRHYGRYKLY